MRTICICIRMHSTIIACRLPQIYMHIYFTFYAMSKCKKRPNKYSSNNVDDSVRLLNFDPFFLYALHAAPFVRCYCCWCAFIEFIRVEKIQFIAVSKCRLCELMHTFCVIIVLAVSAYCSLFGPKLWMSNSKSDTRWFWHGQSVWSADDQPVGICSVFTCTNIRTSPQFGVCVNHMIAWQ